jgi:hypothetical protein
VQSGFRHGFYKSCNSQPLKDVLDLIQYYEKVKWNDVMLKIGDKVLLKEDKQDIPYRIAIIKEMFRKGIITICYNVTF